jgi:hypothetical protein
MRRGTHHRIGAAIAALAATIALAGCANPDSGGLPSGSGGVQNQGEPAAPRTTDGAAPVNLQLTAQAAIAQYAQVYANWSWRTVAAHQRRLAAISVGQARVTDLQAAAQAAGDTTLRQGQISNTGSVISIAPDQAQAGTWVLVTRERTSGSGEYEGLPAGYHVTLAKAQQVRQGWAVSEWAPQS